MNVIEWLDYDPSAATEMRMLHSSRFRNGLRCVHVQLKYRGDSLKEKRLPFTISLGLVYINVHLVSVSIPIWNACS